MSLGAKQVARRICVSLHPTVILQLSVDRLDVITKYSLTLAVVYSADWPFY